MTRSEALELCESNGEWISEEMINQIYDDVEKQLKAKDESIKELNCRVYHAEGYISDLHNEYPKHKKFLNTKARSIVAMLFWNYRRIPDFNMRNAAYFCFREAYSKLKS